MRKRIVGIIFSAFLVMVLGNGAVAEDFNGPLASVKNISSPEPNRYGAGQPQNKLFEEFAKAGVKHVINLRPPSEIPGTNEAAIVTTAGMAYYNIPISSAGDLTRDNVLLIDRVLNQIGEESVLVHCSSSNRVGAIMALRSAWVDGVSVDDAVKVGKRWGLTRLQPAVEELLRK